MKKTLLALAAICTVMTSFAQGVSTVDKKGLNYIVASYSPLQLSGYDDGSSVSTTFSQFGLGYTRGQVLAKFPLYIDFGAQFNYLKKDDMKIYTITVPVNMSYRLSLGHGKMHLTPYTGPYFKYNLSGKNGDADLVFGSGAARRFQFGWQAGVGFSIKAFYVNVAYGYDISKFIDVSDYNHFHGFTFGIGVVL